MPRLSISLSRELYDERHQQVMDMLVEIKAEQKITNGRLRAAELAIAILQWGYGLGAVVSLAWIAWWSAR